MPFSNTKYEMHAGGFFRWNWEGHRTVDEWTDAWWWRCYYREAGLVRQGHLDKHDKSWQRKYPWVDLSISHTSTHILQDDTKEPWGFGHTKE